MNAANERLFDAAVKVSIKRGYKIKCRADLFKRKHNRESCLAMGEAKLILHPDLINNPNYVAWSEVLDLIKKNPITV